jgi:hypothetical protein
LLFSSLINELDATMTSFGPDFDVLSTEQIDVKLEEINRQEAVVQEQLKVLGDSMNIK